MPCRATFTKIELPKLYEEVHKTVTNDLKTANDVALTTDGWTSRASQGFITVTAQFIDPDWQLKNYTLQTRVLEESHTGINIGEDLKEALSEWDLTSKNPSIVTDNAFNMSIAAREAGIEPHVGCLAHTLNLACTKALETPKVRKVLAKVRKIVTFFHRSNTAAAQLKRNQQLLDIPVHRLKIDVKTRWNSTFDMIERYLEQQSAIYASLASKEVKKNIKDFSSLTDNDLSDLESVQDVLKPFKVATLAICDEKMPTITIIGPILNRLIDNCKGVFSGSSRVKDLIAIRTTPRTVQHVF